jgi:hypothetical protein
MEITDKIFTLWHILYSMVTELKLFSGMEPLNFILSLTCTESEKRQGIIRVRDMMFHATFNNISVYRGGQFYWWRKPEYQRKPLTCRKSLTNLMLYREHLAGAEFELTRLVVIGTDCIGSCKPSYHTITTTTVPWNNKLIIIKRQWSCFTNTIKQ